MQNALTFDVEDYFQVEGFSSCISHDDWDRHEPRVVENTRRILDILSAADVKATFFVLGWIADRFPYVVREIASNGHEIASHGYSHRMVYTQTPEEFAEDVERSLQSIRNALAGMGSGEIIGYRAPTFSITAETGWALDILKSNGIRYDSSVFPIKRGRYGIPTAPRFANSHPNGLCEFPPSTLRLFGRNVPVAGGGYFRLYPFAFTSWALGKINDEGYPTVLYLHPWEFDPEQPRIESATRANSFRHYLNLQRTEDRLKRLLRRMSFAPVCEVFAEELASLED